MNRHRGRSGCRCGRRHSPPPHRSPRRCGGMPPPHPRSTLLRKSLLPCFVPPGLTTIPEGSHLRVCGAGVPPARAAGTAAPQWAPVDRLSCVHAFSARASRELPPSTLLAREILPTSRVMGPTILKMARSAARGPYLSRDRPNQSPAANGRGDGLRSEIRNSKFEIRNSLLHFPLRQPPRRPRVRRPPRAAARRRRGPSRQDLEPVELGGEGLGGPLVVLQIGRGRGPGGVPLGADDAVHPVRDRGRGEDVAVFPGFVAAQLHEDVVEFGLQPLRFGEQGGVGVRRVAERLARMVASRSSASSAHLRAPVTARWRSAVFCWKASASAKLSALKRLRPSSTTSKVCGSARSVTTPSTTFDRVTV